MLDETIDVSIPSKSGHSSRHGLEESAIPEEGMFQSPLSRGTPPDTEVGILPHLTHLRFNPL